MHLPAQFPPVYLLDLLRTPDGDIEESDVFGKLELAIEQALSHLKSAGLAADTLIEVSFDDADNVEGIGFFNAEDQMLACVTVYHLDRETEGAADPALREACAGDKSLLQAELNRMLQA
ncbi:hypothetical protein [Burkholderia cenocepacia]|uniref:hypothetical protein n=1 Tax=Burkholderia cenocepacia TaxID=95486 RepID=UPI000761C883|nr:hypothetical protein [Burkholderia cenocepacia]KWU17787.1 hypothetical protein AS149_13790 [Burkholderia cenocepacia]